MVDESKPAAFDALDVKVVAPYFDALLDGSKTFEVRRNDRAYQRGDVLRLWEFDPSRCRGANCGAEDGCPGYSGRKVERIVSFVYSGDPRFGEHGGVQPGYVVLGLNPTTPDPS
jgi:uncharacterized protein DUF3850